MIDQDAVIRRTEDQTRRLIGYSCGDPNREIEIESCYEDDEGVFAPARLSLRLPVTLDCGSPCLSILRALEAEVERIRGELGYLSYLLKPPIHRNR